MNFNELLNDAREFQGVYRRNKLIDPSARFDPYLQKDTRTTSFWTERQIHHKFGQSSTQCQYEVMPASPCGHQLHAYEDAADHIEQAHGVRRARNGTQSRVCKWDGCGKTVTASSLHRHMMTHIGLYHCPVRWCTFKNVRRDVLARHMREGHCRVLDPNYRCGVLKRQ